MIKRIPIQAFSIIFVSLFPILAFAGHNYGPLIATAPSQVHPLGTDVAMTGTAIGGSGNYSYKWYKVNENGSETLVGTGASYHVGVVNEVTTDKYRFQATDNVQHINASDLALLVIFEKVRTLHFDEGSGEAESWGTGSASPSYTAPSFGVYDGYLSIKGEDNNTFGYWESSENINDPDEPLLMLEQPYLLYMSRYLVKTDVLDPSRVPCTRVRMNRWLAPDQNSGLIFGAALGGAMVKMMSVGTDTNSYRPCSKGRYLDLFYAPSFREGGPTCLSTPFSAALDYINIGGYDDTRAELSLEEYSLVVINTVDLPVFTNDHTYTFSTGQEGWQHGSAAPALTSPVFLAQNGCLSIQGVDYNTFGFWESPERMYENGRLYRVSFAIRTSTNSSQYPKCPSFRLRANSYVTGDDWCTEYVVDSDVNATLSPKQTVQTYDAYFMPPQRDGVKKYKLSFDYVNLNPNDNMNDILYLEEVKTEYVPLSSLNTPSPEKPVSIDPKHNEQNVSVYPVLKARRRADYSLNPSPSSLQYEFRLYPPNGDPTIVKPVPFYSYDEYIAVNITPANPLPWGPEGGSPYNYAWRVRGIDSKGNVGGFSSIFNFTVRKDQDGDGIIDDVDPDPLNGDVNNNGIPDGEEDDDNDGIPNAFEYNNILSHGGDNGYYMDPNKSDTDGDGVPDLTELSWNTKPNATDSDSDGISDKNEIKVNKTDPLNPDTDDDDMSDSDEISDGLNPCGLDTDNDGIPDDQEQIYGTDPKDNDTDNDTIPDGFECGPLFNSLVSPMLSYPSGVLCKGTDSTLLINDNPVYPYGYTPSPTIGNVTWDHYKNGIYDDPDIHYDPDYVWSGDCEQNEFYFEYIDLGIGNLSSYGTCWKNYGTWDRYYPCGDRSGYGFYHAILGDTVGWKFKRTADNPSYIVEEEYHPFLASSVGAVTLTPDATPVPGGVTHSPKVYVYDINYTPPNSDDIPRNYGDSPVKIPYEVTGFKEGELKWVKMTILGREPDWDYPKQHVLYSVNPEGKGEVIWDGTLYGDLDNCDTPKYLTKSSDVYFSFEVCLNNAYACGNELNILEPYGSNKYQTPKVYTNNLPGLYFIQPENSSLFLVGEAINYQLVGNSGDYTVDAVHWQTDANHSGQGSTFQKTYTNPGVYEARASMKYDSNKDGTIDYKDKAVHASCKVNVISINELTVTDNKYKERHLQDNTNDHGTPAEPFYLIEENGESSWMKIELNASFSSSSDGDKWKKSLLWKITDLGGNITNDWSANQGNFYYSVFTGWNNKTQREYYVYAGVDKNQNRILDIDLEAIRRIKVVVCKIKLKQVDFMEGNGNFQLKQQTPQEDYTNDTFADNGTYTITYESLDTDGDGNRDLSHPICYKRESIPQMTITIKTIPNLSLSLVGKLKVCGYLGSGSFETFYESEKALIGSETIFENQVWIKSLPNEISKKDLTLLWYFSIDGGENYFSIGYTSNEVFLIYNDPILVNSTSSPNYLTCKRIFEIIYKLVSRLQGDIQNPETRINDIAKAIQDWRDYYKNRIWGEINAHSGSEIWGLIDNPAIYTGQCAEGSLLMEQALRILGIDALYCHVFASKDLPVRVGVNVSGVIPDILEVTGPLPRYCSYCNKNEYLSLDFTSVWGFVHDPNVGEGCCWINGKIYPAFVGEFVGETGTPSSATSAAHSILLQFEAKWSGYLQRWVDSNRNICPNPNESKTREPVPGYIY